MSKEARLAITAVFVGVVLLLILLIALVTARGTKAPQKAFTYDNYAELATDPDSFKGSTVDIEGEVLKNPEIKGSNTSFQMYADPEHREWNTVVHAQNAPSISAHDNVRVAGTVTGEREGKNAFGARVSAVEVRADSVEVLERTSRQR